MPKNILLVPPVSSSNQLYENYHGHIFLTKIHEKHCVLLYGWEMPVDILLVQLCPKSLKPHKTMVPT